MGFLVSRRGSCGPQKQTLFTAKAKTVNQTLGQLLKLQQKVQGGQKMMSKLQER